MFFDGIVQNSQNNQPIENASVAANLTTDPAGGPSTISAVTASDGSYSLTGATSGPYQIRISFPGFTTVTLSPITFASPADPATITLLTVYASSTNVSTYGFTNAELIRNLYSNLGLTNITDDTENTDYVVNQAIRDAEQTVWSRLNKYFEVDKMKGNPWIESRTTWIACYYLSKRRGNEHYFQDNFEGALTELNAMNSGELTPPVEIPLRDHTYPSMSNLMIDEWFSVSKTRVLPQTSVGGPHPNQNLAYSNLWAWGWF